MVQLVVFVNLFFVPALALYMIYWKRKKPLQLDLDLLFQYCIIVACNVPLAKVFIFLIKKSSGIFIPIDSGYYTLAALISAFFIYKLYMYYASERNKQYWVKQYAYYKAYLNGGNFIEKIRKRGAKRILNELLPAYFLAFASCFMMLVFEPILLYAANINDFWFDLWIMIGPLLGVFACFLLGGFFVASLIYFVNLLFSGRVILFRGLNLVGFIAFFLLYVQGNWLAGNLPTLTGEPIAWESYGKSENAILVIVLALLGIAAVMGIRKFKLGRTVRYAAAGAGIVSIMLFVSLIPTVISNGALIHKDTFCSTTENFNTISSNRNFLIFLVDTVDSRVFYDVLTHDADFEGILNDFTYYSDTLSVFSMTRDSIPNILTGTANHNETSFLNYSSNAYNQSPLFQKLEQNGYGINLYSNSIIWDGQRNFEIENSTSISDIKVNFGSFMEQELKYIRYKYLPYGLKRYSQIETLDFNNCKKDGPTQSKYDWGNITIYDNIRRSGVLEKRDENYFQLVHCEGGHYPWNMDKYLNITDGELNQETYRQKYSQKVAASLTMIKAFLQRLKDNDTYDNSVIVIMADHGESEIIRIDSDPYLWLSRCNPILFVKGFNERHELLEADCPVSYYDLQDAFCALIDGKPSTELFSGFLPGRTRTVIWYLRNEENHMVESEITGKSWELEKFAPTGNVYDLEQ